MAGLGLKIVFLFNFIYLVHSSNMVNSINEDVFDSKVFVAWPNGSVPFFINQDHFDNEQSMTIMRGLSLFAFKTCLKFLPVMVAPTDDQHVMTFENPGGTKKCDLMRHGHVRNGPHRMTMGYECLRSPMLERVIMRSLGFPYEHNRAIRDAYLDVQLENIEQSAVELFAKDFRLPQELRPLPYDIHSVMHFDDRDYSKNGHRTFIFKDRNAKQMRNGLSDIDLRKIELVYGPECRHRDRQEKLELCHQYPGGQEKSRKKRDLDDTTKSLRVNPDITPPPDILAQPNRNLTKEVSESLNALGVATEVEGIVDNLYKLSAVALQNARIKYCNESLTKTALRADGKNRPDILGVIELIADYVSSMVTNAVSNLPEFCEEALSVDKYQRFTCHGAHAPDCPKGYKSTRSGPVKFSTQHRPVYIQSTKHVGGAHRVPHVEDWARTGNHTESETDNEKITDAKKEESVDKKDELVVKDEEKKDGVVELEVKERAHDVNVKDDEGVTVSMKQDTVLQDSSVHSRAKRSARAHRRKIAALREGRDSDESATVKPKSKPKRRRMMPETVMLSKANEEFYEERRWPHRVVHYMIDKSAGKAAIADLRSRLNEVNKLLRERTCVHITEIKKKDVDKYDDYLVIDNSPDYVTGRVGGKQFFGSSELLKGGQHRQHAAMMVMAMLGFYFEPARHDRDKYIRVHNRHIRADKLHHFEKIRSDATLSVPYDYKSATHPAWQFWRKVGKKGISTVATYKDQDPDGNLMKSLGQNQDLFSDGDYVKINSVYGIECMTKGQVSKEKSEESDEVPVKKAPSKKVSEKKRKIKNEDEISD